MRNPNRLPTSLAALAFMLALASSAIAADTVYKWKDANGQSHYSQSPPPSGTKYQTVTPAIGPAPPSASAASASSGSGQPASASTSFKPAESRTSEAAIALRHKNCDTARKNVTTLSTYPYANLDTTGTGKPAPVNAEQRAAEVARANQMVTQYCGSN